MIIDGNKYMWQFISAADGRRSEPFIATIEQFKTITVDTPVDEREGIFVLLLADVSAENQQDFVLRFPVYRLSTFLTLDLSLFVKPLFIEEISHG